MSADDATCVVRHKTHREAVDLSGRDLVSLFDRTREEVAAAMGVAMSADGMAKVRAPNDKVTTATGDVADEVHDWPRATLGSSFRRLSLQFKAGRLVGFQWGFRLEDFLKTRKPWYRRWFG